MDPEWTRNGPGMDPEWTRTPVPTTNKFTLLAGEDRDVSLTETTLPVIAVKKTVSLVKNSPIGKSIDGDTQTTSDDPAVTLVNVNPESLSAGNSKTNVNPVTAHSPSRGEAGNVKMDVLRETPKVLYTFTPLEVDNTVTVEGSDIATSADGFSVSSTPPNISVTSPGGVPIMEEHIDVVTSTDLCINTDDSIDM